MPTSCCAYGCTSRHTKGCEVQFFSFPFKEEHRLAAWVAAISRQNWKPTKTSRICSKHFKPEDFLHRPGTYIKHLKPTAVPSIFHLTFHEFPPQTVEESMEMCVKKGHIEPEVNSDEEEYNAIEVSGNNEVCDDDIHTVEAKVCKDVPGCSTNDPGQEYIVLSTHEQNMETNNENSEEYKEILRLRHKIRMLKQKLSRRDKKMKSLRDLISELKRKGMIDNDPYLLLSEEFSGIPLEVLKNYMRNSKKNSASKRYSDDIKRFALTLHYYSPKAYNYCRKILCLPHPSSLRNWTSAINAEPGFQKEVFSQLSALSLEDRNCALMFDSMAIRKQILWSSTKQKYVGYCDYGNGLHLEGANNMATEVLVFMLVGLKGNWKWPIGYFFINKTVATTLSELIKSALALASDAGLKTWTVTCDGATINISALQMLGCNIQVDKFEDLKCFFMHPNRNDKIYVILDPCHMIKLARNCLGDLKVMTSDKGIIRWNMISNLHNLQQQLSLKFKNKLSSACILYQQNKMKVKYATQTLSSSVADAIAFLDSQKVKEFQDSAPTTEFIKNIDRVFDFLNSRNPFGKGFKKPITLTDLPFLKNVIKEKINYLFSLKHINGTPLHEGRRKTFICGLALATKSILSVSEQILKQNNNFKYILTYKFSQDHIEILFSTIRNRHGFNNNPNVVQFSTAMKQILMKNAITSSPAANCIAIDTDFIGCVFDIKWVKKSKYIMSEDEDVEDLPSNEPVINAHLSEFTENILYYISGYIVKQLLKHVKCVSCANNIVYDNYIEHNYVHYAPHTKFTDYCNRGGLTMPSNSVFKIIRETELEIQRRTSNFQILTRENLAKQIVLSVKRKFALDHNIFRKLDCEDGDLTQRPHKLMLITSVCSKFVDIRLYSYAKFINKELLLPYRKRHQLTKQILFRNE